MDHVTARDRVQLLVLTDVAAPVQHREQRLGAVALRSCELLSVLQAQQHDRQSLTHAQGPRYRAPLGVLRVLQRRSEEHTSELQSRGHLVCRLLLAKKNQEKSTTA